MSRRGEEEYKPQNYKGRQQTGPVRTRPTRAARTVTSYEEKRIVISSEEDAASTESDGISEDTSTDRLEGLDLDRLWSDTTSVGTVKSEACWSPQTVNKKTEHLISNLENI